MVNATKKGEATKSAKKNAAAASSMSKLKGKAPSAAQSANPAKIAKTAQPAGNTTFVEPIFEESATKPAEAFEDDPESDWSSEDEDEDNGGVSSKGMERLMKLVQVEDLDEYERARLEGDDGDDDGEEDEDDDDFEDDEEEGVDEDEEVSDEEEMEGSIGGESASEEEDEDEDQDEAAPVDNSVLIAEADEDALDLDDVGSDVSVDEDAVPERKVTINNRPALRLLTEKINLTKQPWPEHLILTTKEMVEVDPSDDLKREMAFYKLALDAVAPARKLARKHDIPFDRPSDYYAEMVKSDEHMERVRTKLVDESTTIKKSEAARRQRELKKFGKQIQHEKLKQREQDKKSFNERVQGIKRKRKDGMDLGEDGDEFGIEIDDDGPSGSSGGRGGAAGRGQRKMPRSARDAKYSLGGGGKRSKQNTRESTNDFGGGGGGGRGGFGGGRGGGRGGRGGKAGRGGARPGKSRRHK